MMQRPLSLTLRLTLLFSAAAAVVLLLFGWIVGRALDDHFATEDISELRVIARSVEQSLATLHASGDFSRLNQRFSDILVGHHGAMLQITGASGGRLYTTPGADFSALPLPAADELVQGVVRRWSDEKHHYRLFIQRMAPETPAATGSYTVITAVTIDFHLRFLNDFRHTLWFMVLSGIALMGVMGWVAVRQGHGPLRQMVEQIRRISANELNTRLSPESVPGELSALALSFNEMLGRMEDAFLRLSNFSADIAHELRTPVTNLMTQTQVALSQARSAAEYQEILYSNMEEYERMAQMIGDMLFLAKADNGLNPPNAVDIELENEVRNLFDYYGAWAEERHVSLTLDGAAHVHGDRLMLRRALGNLLANAIRHTPPGKGVHVQLGSTTSDVVIVVENPGAPIPAEHLSRIFDRFYRIDPSRQRSGEGAGLGLAIVRSIVESHGGKVAATSGEAGTRFSVTLPVR